MKNFVLHGNQFILRDNFNLTHRENHHLYKNRCYIANKSEKLRTITMCSASTPDTRHGNINIKFLGTCFVQIQCVCLYFACTERSFNPLKEVTISVPNESPCARCVMFPLMNKKLPFSWSLLDCFMFLKWFKNRITMFWKWFLSWKVLLTTKVCLFPRM